MQNIDKTQKLPRALIKISLYLLGLVCIFVSTKLGQSEYYNNTIDMASRSTSSRSHGVLVFFGILRYGLLIAGVTIILTTLVMNIKELLKR